jgi:hypothetical protein
MRLRTPLAQKGNLGNTTPPGTSSSQIIRETPEEERPPAEISSKKRPSDETSLPKKKRAMNKFQTTFGFSDKRKFDHFQVHLSSMDHDITN